MISFESWKYKPYSSSSHLNQRIVWFALVIHKKQDILKFKNAHLERQKLFNALSLHSSDLFISVYLILLIYDTHKVFLWPVHSVF